MLSQLLYRVPYSPSHLPPSLLLFCPLCYKMPLGFRAKQLWPLTLRVFSLSFFLSPRL